MASFTFINDSVYILRGEKAQDQWVSTGSWKKVSKKTIFLRPNKDGLKIKGERKGRIWKADGNIIFQIKDEKVKIQCKRGEEAIIIDDYKFKLK